MAVLLVLSALAGCAGGAAETSGVPAFVVEHLPADFPPQPLFLCVDQDTESSESGSFIGYRGTVADDSPPYMETAFLRLSAIAFENDPGRTRGLDGADVGSERPALVNGGPATAFTISTAEPVLTPWPAITWQQDGATLTLLGEGMTADDVLQAAESVRVATPADLALGSFIGEEACS